MAVNKVARGDGLVLIDLSTDTVTSAYDIIAGKVGHLATGAIVTGLGSETLDFTDISASGDGNVTIEGTSGGSITITNEANATGTTCVITTNAEPTPGEDIPLNTQLIDFTAITTGYYIGGDGEPHTNIYSYCSDFTEIDPSMTFIFKGYQWWNLGFYNSSKTFISGGAQDNYKDSVANEIVTGTLSSANIPSNAAYIRLSGYPYSIADASTMSLIRTA